jgi:hypothetical protein
MFIAAKLLRGIMLVFAHEIVCKTGAAANKWPPPNCLT